MSKTEDMAALRRQIREGLARTAEPARTSGVRGPGASADPHPQHSGRVIVDEAAAFGAPAGALCGHTAISGKRCNRPLGHAEKNHRYPKTDRAS